MVSAEDLKKDDMVFEGVERMERMEVHYSQRWNYMVNRVPVKVSVNHEERKIGVNDLSDEEIRMIRSFEKEHDVIVYYFIEDTGLWPDGARFPRQSFLYVGRDEADYEYAKDCIAFCNTVPAYVKNLEDDRCSEFVEMPFEEVNGTLVNAS